LGRFKGGLPEKSQARQAERSLISLRGFFDLVGPVLAIFHLSFQVVDLFEIRFHVLEHIKGLAASGTGRTDEDNRLVGRKRIYFFLELIDGNIDGRLKVAVGKLIRVPHINQINALRIFFYYFFKGRKID